MNQPPSYEPSDGTSRWPKLWLGTWSLGGEGFGATDGRASRQLLQHAFDAGIRHFDSAGFYAHGKSERLLGQALKKVRSQIFISSKGGLRWQGRTVSHAATPEDLRQDLEQSLKQLNTDYLDLFQLHWPDPKVPVAESLDALKAMQLEGKIRTWGVGNLSAAEIDSLLTPNEQIPHQTQHSLLYRSDAVLAAGKHQQRCFNCITSPLAQGLLGSSDSQQGLSNLGKRDVRRRNGLFHSAEVRQWLEQLETLLTTTTLTKPEVALSWLTQQSDVDAIIVGPKTPQQLQQLLQIWDQIETSTSRLLDEPLSAHLKSGPNHLQR